ncbi:pyridoxamine 5'-phosphate oxidase family protein [Streptomyces sp. NPDC018322]
MWETVPRLLARHRYLVLGTADGEGRPWASPVFFAADGQHRVVWVSSPDSRHSRNTAARPEVAIAAFDTAAPVGGAEAMPCSTPVCRPLTNQCRRTSGRLGRCWSIRPRSPGISSSSAEGTPVSTTSPMPGSRCSHPTLSTTRAT